MKLTQIMMLAIVGFVAIMQFETTNAIQLTQKVAEPMESCQNYNLVEKKKKRRSNDDDDSQLNPQNGANIKDMLKVDNEVKKQLDNLEMNPLLREIIANSNSIDIAKDVKNPQKDTAGAVAAAVEASGNKL